jgi:nucleoside-diphosphate-sugar epimerase
MSGSTMITGTSGHVGSALAASLAAQGVRIVGVDRQPGPLTTVVGNLASIDLAPVIAECDTVIHCAALHAPHLAEHSRADFVAANVTATERLCDAAREAGVARLVFISTTSVYGHALDDDDSAVWVTEDLKPEPRDIYDETKLVAEQVVASVHCTDLTTITLRLARCFPETHRDTVVNRLYRGLDMRDAVRGITAAAQADLTGYHVLNLAGPRVFERSDVGELKTDAALVIDRRVPSLREEFQKRSWEIPSSIDRVYVSDTALDILGYEPAYGIEESIGGDHLAPMASDFPTAC